MILNDSDTLVELEITGYEFPEIDDDGSDSEWLIAWLKIISKGKELINENIGAALDTQDVRDLSNWLKDIAEGQPYDKKSISVKYPTLDFLEPDLEFKFLGYAKDCARVRVIYGTLDDNPIKVDLDLTIQAIKKALDVWDKNIRHFPYRSAQ